MPSPLPAPNERVDLDTRTLRALAHPVRVRLMSLLREHGPSNATRLADQLGLNTGASSYHLRQLAAAGLVEEDTERGNARERWWRSVHRATYFDPYELPESDRPASAVYLTAIAADYAERLQRAAHEFLTYPEAWQRSGDMSDFRLVLTPGEAAQLVAEVHAVIETYRRSDAVGADRPPDAQVVWAQVQVMPQLPPELRTAPIDPASPTDHEETEPS